MCQLVMLALLFLISYVAFISSEMWGWEWLSNQTSWAPVSQSNAAIKFTWSIVALAVAGYVGRAMGYDEGYDDKIKSI